MGKIKHIFRIMLLIWVSLACVSQASADEYLLVRKVYDGDTIELGNGMHVRYIGINAPEIAHQDKAGEPFGLEALAFNEKIVLSKSVRIQGDQETSDQYNRRLAYVFLQDGTFVNQEIVRNGLAHVLYTSPNTAYDAVLLKSQQEAMKAGKGMWANWKEKPSDYIGNKKSRRFHLKTCAFGLRTSAQNRVQFGRKWDAFWEGYAPCKKCMGQGSIE
ncbi:MAG: thermonuclease family protein [Deltaproteobacteria bacterium]|nr:thermonuclease family protein [Deltaproteobacteria bacterium]